MTTYIYEIVKDYLFHHQPEDAASMVVRGRVSRRRGADEFFWEISHHYIPAPGAMTYYPSSRTFDNFEGAEAALLAYGGAFTSAHGVTPTTNY